MNDNLSEQFPLFLIAYLKIRRQIRQQKLYTLTSALVLLPFYHTQGEQQVKIIGALLCQKVYFVLLSHHPNTITNQLL